MGRKAELVKRRDLAERVAALDENARIAREALGVAGDRDDDGNAARRERPRLRLGAGARRIEHDGVEAVEFLRRQRPVEEIAPLGA